MNEPAIAQLLAALESRELKLAFAESLTGGLLSSNFVSVAGASKVVLGSIVAYQDEVKHSLLGVAQNLLEARGAVSAEVATEMAQGARDQFSRAASVSLDRTIAISTTGVAGPGDEGSVAAGTVCIAIAAPGGHPSVQKFSFAGTRTEVREAAVNAAVAMLRDYLAG